MQTKDDTSELRSQTMESLAEKHNEPTSDDSLRRHLSNLASGGFGSAANAFHKTRDATKFVVREIENNPHTAQVVDAGKEVYNTVKGSVVDATSKVGNFTIDAGNQMYLKISESPIIEKALRWTGSTVGYLAETLGMGYQVYQIAAASPITGQVIQFTGAAVGSTVALNMMKKSAASRVGRELVRASCIRNSLWIFSKLRLPTALRSTAVFTGVRIHNYIASGVIPGLGIAWALYDGYKIARYLHDKLSNKDCLQEEQSQNPEKSTLCVFFGVNMTAAALTKQIFAMGGPPTTECAVSKL